MAGLSIPHNIKERPKVTLGLLMTGKYISQEFKDKVDREIEEANRRVRQHLDGKARPRTNKRTNNVP